MMKLSRKVWPMRTETPRATATTRTTPIMSPAPLTKVSMKPRSPVRLTMAMRIELMRNQRAAS